MTEMRRLEHLVIVAELIGMAAIINLFHIIAISDENWNPKAIIKKNDIS